MQKILIWYGLQLKSWCRLKINWMLVLGMIILVYFLSHIAWPDKENIQIGLCNQGTALGETLVESLQQRDSVFSYRVYEEEEQLSRDLISGKLECGFLFQENLEKGLQEGTYKNLITYLATPLTTKGYIAQETVFAALFQLQSDRILEQHADELFDVEQGEIEQLLLEKSKQYQGSRDVFQVESRVLPVVDKNRIPEQETKPTTGIVGMMIFLLILFSAYGEDSEKICHGMERKDRMQIRILGYLANITIPAVIGIILIVLGTESRGIQVELAAMVVLISYSILWAMACHGLMKRKITFFNAILAILILNVMICPICFDLSTYIPAVKYFRYLFPAGVYLMI